MSFLAGRLAGKEAAYFLQESYQVVARLLEQKPQIGTPPSSSDAGAADSQSAAVDVLPEVLRHSLPPKIFRQQQLSASSSPTSAAGPSSLLLAPIPSPALVEGETEVVQGQTEEVQVNTKLYFGNLPYHCDNAQLAGIVQQYGTPELVEEYCHALYRYPRCSLFRNLLGGWQKWA